MKCGGDTGQKDGPPPYLRRRSLQSTILFVSRCCFTVPKQSLGRQSTDPPESRPRHYSLAVGISVALPPGRVRLRTNATPVNPNAHLNARSKALAVAVGSEPRPRRAVSRMTA